MKKEITIPVGKITSILTVGAGICTSALVHAGLKKVSTGNKVVDSIGRDCAASAISTAFTMLAMEQWSDNSMDIKIPIGKNKSHMNGIVRLNEAMAIWNDIIADAINANEYVGDSRNYFIPDRLAPDYVKIQKFNDIMTKITKDADIRFKPINCDTTDYSLVKNICTRKSDIISCIKQCYEYYNGFPLNDSYFKDVEHHDGIELFTLRDKVTIVDKMVNDDESLFELISSSRIANEIVGIYVSAGYPKSEEEILINDIKEALIYVGDDDIIAIVEAYIYDDMNHGDAYCKIRRHILNKKFETIVN